MTKKKQPIPTPSEKTKSQLYAKLAKLGIASVLIGYDGCGDSGCIERITAIGPDKLEIELPERTISIALLETTWQGRDAGFVTTNVRRNVPIRDAVENWCYDLLEQHFGGWELNEGSQGTITVDVAEKTATIEHEANVMRTLPQTVVV